MSDVLKRVPKMLVELSKQYIPAVEEHIEEYVPTVEPPTIKIIWGNTTIESTYTIIGDRVRICNNNQDITKSIFETRISCIEWLANTSNGRTERIKCINLIIWLTEHAR